VLGDVGAEHQIELGVHEGERGVGLDRREPRVRQAGARALERYARRVRERQRRRVELGGQATVARAEVERVLGARKGADERDQVLRRGAAVLGDELPELVVVTATRRRAPSRRRGSSSE
jgi:hypothetical protein